MESKKYMLLNDHDGKIVPISKLQSVKRSITQTVSRKAFRGDLFKDSGKAYQSSDPSKIVVLSLEDSSNALEIDSKSLVELDIKEADLLGPVSTAQERYQLFLMRTKLEQALTSCVNDKVYLIHGSRNCKGVIKHKGYLEGKKGTYFGIRLQSPVGDSDGSLKGNKYFEAKPNHAIFVSMEKIDFARASLPSDYLSMEKENEQSKDDNNATVSSSPDSFKTLGDLKLGMRVITFGQDNENKEKVLHGSIRFIGKAKLSQEVTVGIELDTPDGYGSGFFESNKVFDCERNHALFTGVDTIMNEEDYKKNTEVPSKSEKDESIKEIRAGNSRAYKMTSMTKYEDKGATDDQNGLREGRILKSTEFQDNRVQNNGEKKIENKIKDLKQSSFDRTDQSNRNKMKATDILQARLSASPTENTEDKYKIVGKGNKDEASKIISAYRGQHLLSDGNLADGKDARNGFETSLESQKRTSASNSISDMKSKEHFDASLGMTGSGPNSTSGPPSYENVILEDKVRRMEYQTSGIQKSSAQKRYDTSLQIDSVVEVSLNGVPHYGLIRWIGVPENLKTEDLIAGLELEVPYEFGTDGSFKGKKYFNCLPGRGFFVKLSNCKKDARFSYALSVPKSTIANHQKVEEIEGFYLAPEEFEDAFIGRMLGIQGHHNSCYMDSTLFAMFAFAIVFDVLLYRERRPDDIAEYDEVRRVLKNAIVNPLRSKGFVNAGSVLQLRRWLDRLGSVQGFMNEEKDPEEFLMLLFRDVLKVDPFITLRTDAGRIEKAFFYQIWIDKDGENPLPSLQYLIEQSFLTGNLKLEEVPSVFIVQLPRFGTQKIYKRIRLNEKLDISKVMSTAVFSCLICGNRAIFSCRDCCQSFGWTSPFVYLCESCNSLVHRNPERFSHQPKYLKTVKPKYKDDDGITILDLFAVVCIKTSHYVTFAKCGKEPDDRWVFFDSMADRIGGEFGHNVPEVVECPEVKQWFNEKPLSFTESDSKNTPEKILRLFEDASLCLYRSKELSIYK